jgi:hypothetical protein
MLTFMKRALAAAIVIAAMALPAAAYAQVDQNPIGASAVPVEPPYLTGPGDASAPAAGSSSGSSFQWGDAGIGAGSLLVLISVGAGAAIAFRRRAGRPVTW